MRKVFINSNMKIERFHGQTGKNSLPLLPGKEFFNEAGIGSPPSIFTDVLNKITYIS